MNPLARFRRFALLLVGVALVAIFAVQVRAARIRSDAAPARAAASALATRSNDVNAEGRVVAYPGADVTLAVDLAGTVASLPVRELSRVRRGQVLLELRADDLRAERAEAVARVHEAEVDLALYDIEVTRAENLLARGDGTQQAVDHARRDRDAAVARRETARAAIARIDATLAKARVVSPIDGVVIARLVQPGESVTPGEPLLRVADLSRVRIEAEVNEFDAGRIRAGAAATITAEGYDDAAWRGHVEEVPGAVVERNVKPEDPARPVDARVLLAKVALDQAAPLKLGQRVEVRIKG